MSTDIHLLLSGGGFRATLFHLGVLRFLYERRSNINEAENALYDIKLITGISGGSITACHFVANLDRYRRLFAAPAGDLIKFALETDMRRRVLSENKSVASVLQHSLFKSRFLLSSVPDDIELAVLGTSFTTGDSVLFRRGDISVWEFDNSAGKLIRKYGMEEDGISLTRLMQASAAFPPFFPPLRIDASSFETSPTNQILDRLAEHEIADGGIRDEWHGRRLKLLWHNDFGLGCEGMSSTCSPSPDVSLLFFLAYQDAFQQRFQRSPSADCPIAARVQLIQAGVMLRTLLAPAWRRRSSAGRDTS